MRVVYSDETGTGDERTEPLTVVAAVMFNMDRNWHPFHENIAKIARGREIKRRRLLRELRNGRTREEATETLSKILSLLRKHRVKVFCGAIHRAGLRGVGVEADSLAEAFSDCLNNVQRYMDSHLVREQVLWIHDRSPKELSVRDQLEWSRALGNLDPRVLRAAEYLNVDTSSWEIRTPPIADTVYFGDSQFSHALQLADVCCSVISAHLMDNRLSDTFFNQIVPSLENVAMPLFAGPAVGRAGPKSYTLRSDS